MNLGLGEQPQGFPPGTHLELVEFDGASGYRQVIWVRLPDGRELLQAVYLPAWVDGDASRRAYAAAFEQALGKLRERVAPTFIDYTEVGT